MIQDNVIMTMTMTCQFHALRGRLCVSVCVCVSLGWGMGAVWFGVGKDGTSSVLTLFRHGLNSNLDCPPWIHCLPLSDNILLPTLPSSFHHHSSFFEVVLNTWTACDISISYVTNMENKTWMCVCTYNYSKCTCYLTVDT